MDESYNVRITAHAIEALREISDYISSELANPEAAVKLLKILKTQINKLSFMPHRIKLTPEEPWHSEGIHRIQVKNFYIYFWIDERQKLVQITDVIYAGRDQEEQLKQMPFGNDETTI